MVQVEKTNKIMIQESISTLKVLIARFNQQGKKMKLQINRT